MLTRIDGSASMTSTSRTIVSQSSHASGPNAPRFPTFRTSQGLTGRAIAAQRIINVGNVAEDNDYLETLATTRSEIIVPALNDADEIVGTLDVESVEANAFDGEQELFLSRCVEELGPLWLHK